MANSHFLPNELFTYSTEGHLFSIYTPDDGALIYKIISYGCNIFSSFTLWKCWCAPPQRWMKTHVMIHLLFYDHRATGEVNFCKDVIILSVKIDRMDNSGPGKRVTVALRHGPGLYSGCFESCGCFLTLPHIPVLWPVLPGASTPQPSTRSGEFGGDGNL